MKETFSERLLLVPKKKELLIGIFCWFMFLLGFSLILPLFFDTTTADGYYWYATTADIACFVLVVIVFFPFLRDSRHMVFPKELLIATLVGFGIYYALDFAAEWIVVDVAIFRYFFLDEQTFLQNPNQAALEYLQDYSPWLRYLCTIVFAPVTEELLVRGMIFAPLCKKKPWLAYVVSCALFIFLHLIAAIGEVSALNMLLLVLMYLPSSIALGWAYQKTRNIYGPIALHCTINLYVTIMNAISAP